MAEEVQNESSSVEETTEKTAEDSTTEVKTVPYDRFAEVNRKAKEAEAKLAKFESESEQRKKQELESKQEFEKLYTEEKTKREELEQNIAKAEKQAVVTKKATDLGFSDPADALRFVDSTLDGDNLQEALTELAKSKPYLLKSEQKTSVNANTDEKKAESGSKRIWAWSELSQKMKNNTWYTENKTEIDLAMSEGRIDKTK